MYGIFLDLVILGSLGRKKSSIFKNLEANSDSTNGGYLPSLPKDLITAFILLSIMLTVAHMMPIAPVLGYGRPVQLCDGRKQLIHGSVMRLGARSTEAGLEAHGSQM